MLAGAIGVAAPAQAPEAERKQTQQDEYTRIEMLAPETGSIMMTVEVAVTTPGATEWTMPLSSSRSRSIVAVTDMMTGQPLKFAMALGRAARHVGAGDRGRRRSGAGAGDACARSNLILARQAFRADLPRSPRRSVARGMVTGRDDDVIFAAVFTGLRNAVVLPAGYRLVACNVPSQVLSLPDGRTQVSFMQQQVVREARTSIYGRSPAPRPATPRSRGR